MKFLTLLATIPLLIGTAHGTLVVTEINSNGSPADFWELINFGATSVSLDGYKWIDSAFSLASPDVMTIPAGTTIAPNESIIFVPAGTNVTTFRTAWNLSGSVQIILGGPGFGQNDAVYLYDSSDSLIASLSYAASGFTRSDGSLSLGGHAGVSAGGAAAQSLIYDPNSGTSSPRYTFATGTNFDSYAAASPNTGVGSPGRIGVAGSNSLPTFTNPARTYWSASVDLSASPFRVVAVDTDPGQSVTLSVIEKPTWLIFSADGPGTFQLNGTPPAGGGDFPFTIRATDDAPIPGFYEATFTLTTFPSTSSILLNEYNAVGPTNFLKGGTATQDELGIAPGPVDSHFGRVAGNGGEWVEFVVVGNGTAGSTTDMRGWTIEILNASNTRSIKLSQDPYWASVVSGILLTFSLNNTANGGLDTEIHRTSALHTTGYLWTHIWAFDPLMVSQAESSFTDTLGIGSNDTRFVVKNSANNVIYGPSGEGMATSDPYNPAALLGVSSTEVLRLQQDPAPTIDPLFGIYNDATSSSTLGAPNFWGGTPTVQNFTGYVRTNSPPRFTSTPVTRAYGSYSYAITTSDPNGNSVALSASGLPSFLTLTPGSPGTATLAANRSLTLADAGQYPIRIIANDGSSFPSSTPQVFMLTVLHNAPSVILNEFNAVSSSNFLNGGDALTDLDGLPASVDSHFGRIAGNGGNWFELVVVGNGGPSTVDMRGWTIEIGSSIGGSFTSENRLVLSQHTFWSAVPAGTLLTFIENSTANGGLDTEINRRNRLATHGDAWTNVWMGDPDLLVFTNPTVNGYNLDSGIVSGIRINNNDTQFIVKNAATQAVFGPVGEGIAPVSGISNIEIFELEGHPSPAVSPLVTATLTGLGYDDGASGSTFGEINRWQADGGGEETLQDFSPFILPATPYSTWALFYQLDGLDADADADPDHDGRSNLNEYAFGGNPNLADASPVPQQVVSSGTTLTWTYLRRADDASLIYQHQYSDKLQTWFPVSGGDLQISTQPHPTLTGYETAIITITGTPQGVRFFRSSIAGF